MDVKPCCMRKYFILKRNAIWHYSAADSGLASRQNISQTLKYDMEGNRYDRRLDFCTEFIATAQKIG